MNSSGLEINSKMYLKLSDQLISKTNMHLIRHMQPPKMGSKTYGYLCLNVKCICVWCFDQEWSVNFLFVLNLCWNIFYLIHYIIVHCGFDLMPARYKCGYIQLYNEAKCFYMSEVQGSMDVYSYVHLASVLGEHCANVTFPEQSPWTPRFGPQLQLYRFCLGRTLYTSDNHFCVREATRRLKFRHRWAERNHPVSDHLYWLRVAQSVA